MVFARFLIWNLDYRKTVEKEIRAGLLLDAGIYTVQFACFAYGEKPISVKAEGKVIHTGKEWQTRLGNVNVNDVQCKYNGE